jgi:hypothetical protein
MIVGLGVAAGTSAMTARVANTGGEKPLQRNLVTLCVLFEDSVSSVSQWKTREETPDADRRESASVRGRESGYCLTSLRVSVVPQVSSRTK